MGEPDWSIAERVERVVANHVARATPRLALPWETSFFQGSRQTDFLPELPVAAVVPMPREVGVVSSTTTRRPLPLLEPRKRPRPKSWRENIEDARQVALHAWKALIAGFEAHSEVGRQMALAPDEEVSMTILSDALADKSTSTLKSRASALNGYWAWCQGKQIEPSPLVEASVYEYCKYCQAIGSAPTKVNSLRSAILFASHVLGWVVQRTLLDSRRIAGVAFSELQRLPPVKHREALEPSFILFLAKLTCSDEEGLEQRNLTGFYLFLVLTRARFSDGMSVAAEPAITQKGKWVEATVKEYKTSKARDRRGRDLPLVAPAMVRTLPWAQEWLACRSELGCRAGDGEPMLPLFVNQVKTSQMQKLTKDSANYYYKLSKRRLYPKRWMCPSMELIRVRGRHFIGLL